MGSGENGYLILVPFLFTRRAYGAFQTHRTTRQRLLLLPASRRVSPHHDPVPMSGQRQITNLIGLMGEGEK